MGREVRRVPKDWQHPKVKRFNYVKGVEEEIYQPMFDRSFAEAMDEWYVEWKAWERGEKPKDIVSETYWEYAGYPPDPKYYMPQWPEHERTHLMMYEETSEGTPISPAFETPEELARWLTDNHASAFAGQTASYEGWLRICRGGFAPSAVMTVRPEGGGTIQNGVDALL